MLGEGPSNRRGTLFDCENFAKVRFQLYFKLQHRSQGWWRALDVCLRHLSVGNPLKIFLHSNCGGAATRGALLTTKTFLSEVDIVEH